MDFAALDVDGFLGATRISADSLAFTPLEGIASQSSGSGGVGSSPRSGMVTTPLRLLHNRLTLYWICGRH